MRKYTHYVVVTDGKKTRTILADYWMIEFLVDRITTKPRYCGKVWMERFTRKEAERFGLLV